MEKKERKKKEKRISFFFNDTATTEIYTLSLHDALPIYNVLGFPYIFRGALDVRATGINEAMKLAAVKAIADLAKQVVPEAVNVAYHEKNIMFGKDFIIPKPLDPRLITVVAPAVAKAAMDSGIAQHQIKDWRSEEHTSELQSH